ncbi:hypothetical protein NIES22_47910 [Calothrix brevissima NIES-22]|nr:hypothetical protein NIES22_47910 [Calothrix brevissima NIES-22]
MMKYILINFCLIISSILGIAGQASAERLVTAAVDSDGRVYQVDLDERSEYETDSGWRHVTFWLSTKGDIKKHSAIASCSPYDVKSEYYDFEWLSSGGGYPEGTVAGDIARVACNES